MHQPANAIDHAPAANKMRHKLGRKNEKPKPAGKNKGHQPKLNMNTTESETPRNKNNRAPRNQQQAARDTAFRNEKTKHSIHQPNSKTQTAARL